MLLVETQWKQWLLKLLFISLNRTLEKQLTHALASTRALARIEQWTNISPSVPWNKPVFWIYESIIKYPFHLSIFKLYSLQSTLNFDLFVIYPKSKRFTADTNVPCCHLTQHPSRMVKKKKGTPTLGFPLAAKNFGGQPFPWEQALNILHLRTLKQATHLTSLWPHVSGNRPSRWQPKWMPNITLWTGHHGASERSGDPKNNLTILCPLCRTTVRLPNSTKWTHTMFETWQKHLWLTQYNLEAEWMQHGWLKTFL